MSSYTIWECDRCHETAKFDDGVQEWGIITHRHSGEQSRPTPESAWLYYCPGCYRWLQTQMGMPAGLRRATTRP